jgi:hypothetical protein
MVRCQRDVSGRSSSKSIGRRRSSRVDGLDLAVVLSTVLFQTRRCQCAQLLVVLSVGGADG